MILYSSVHKIGARSVSVFSNVMNQGGGEKESIPCRRKKLTFKACTSSASKFCQREPLIHHSLGVGLEG